MAFMVTLLVYVRRMNAHYVVSIFEWSSFSDLLNALGQYRCYKSDEAQLLGLRTRLKLLSIFLSVLRSLPVAAIRMPECGTLRRTCAATIVCPHGLLLFHPLIYFQATWLVPHP